MPASHDPDPTPERRWRALAGPVVLALWLGWTLPALWAQARADAEPTGSDWTAAQILARVPPALLTASAGQPMLLRAAATCGCAPAQLPPGGVRVAPHRLALPFEWLVLQDQRLVYAGPAVLGRACGGAPLAATRLVTHLLQDARPAVILSAHCPCQKE